MAPHYRASSPRSPAKNQSKTPRELLHAFYVARPHAPLKRMRAYLEARPHAAKVLFSGHRGSGKSTELMRLAKDIGDRFFVVRFSAQDLSLSDINCVDVMLACAARLFREAALETGQPMVPPAVWREVHTWLTSELTPETTIEVKKGGSFAGKVKALALSLEGKYGQETSTRTIVRERLFSRVGDLIGWIDTVCEALRAATGRAPLIICEDLDKADIAHAREMFFDHGTTLSRPACHVIYTFPIGLCYSTEFRERIGDYTRHFLLPNVSVCERDGSPNANGRKALREVVTRRVSAGIFDDDALDDIIQLSGGLMRDLVRLASESALITLTEGATVVTRETVQQVAAEVADDYRRMLRPEHYETLRTVRETKQITADETVRQLLESLSLLEYRNRVAWCDVHPIAQMLLDES